MIPIYGLVQDVFILETCTGRTTRAYCIQHAHALLRAHMDLHGEIARIHPSVLDTCALCNARARARAQDIQDDEQYHTFEPRHLAPGGK